MASASGSPDLTRNVKEKGANTPYQTPLLEKQLVFPPTMDIDSENEVSIREELDQTPAPSTPVGLEAVLQSIHATIKKNKLKLNQMTDSQTDMEDRLSSKLTLAVDKALGNIPMIVNTAVDKRLGDITKETGSRLDELEEDMNRREKKIMNEIEELKKTTKKAAPGVSHGEFRSLRDAADKVVQLEKLSLIHI